MDYSGSFWKETCRRFQIDVLLGNGWNCGEGSTLDGSRRYGLCYQPYIKERVCTGLRSARAAEWTSSRTEAGVV